MVDALIIDACRTPRGIGKAGKGALSGIHPQQLGATVLRALADRTGINTADVDDIIVPRPIAAAPFTVTASKIPCAIFANAPATRRFTFLLILIVLTRPLRRARERRFQVALRHGKHWS